MTIWSYMISFSSHDVSLGWIYTKIVFMQDLAGPRRVVVVYRIAILNHGLCPSSILNRRYCAGVCLLE